MNVEREIKFLSYKRNLHLLEYLWNMKFNINRYKKFKPIWRNSNWQRVKAKSAPASCPFTKIRATSRTWSIESEGSILFASKNEISSAEILTLNVFNLKSINKRMWNWTWTEKCVSKKFLRKAAWFRYGDH